MKQLAYYHLEGMLPLDGVTKYCLAIEDPHEFYKVVDMLNRQVSSEEEGFVLSESTTAKVLSLKDHSDILIDYFNMDFNDRKIKNLLYSRVEDDIKHSDLSSLYQKLVDSYRELIDGVIQKCDVMTSASEESIGIQDYLKLSDLKILEQYNSPLEMIMNYIDIIYKLRNIDILFLVNIREILNDEELKQLFLQCSYMKLSVITIEKSKPKVKMPDEKVILIDSDLCQIES
jgi:CRISPR type II-A-associated protein Csn2